MVMPPGSLEGERHARPSGFTGPGAEALALGRLGGRAGLSLLGTPQRWHSFSGVLGCEVGSFFAVRVRLDAELVLQRSLLVSFWRLIGPSFRMLLSDRQGPGPSDVFFAQSVCLGLGPVDEASLEGCGEWQGDSSRAHGLSGPEGFRLTVQPGPWLEHLRFFVTRLDVTRPDSTRLGWTQLDPTRLDPTRLDCGGEWQGYSSRVHGLSGLEGTRLTVQTGPLLVNLRAFVTRLGSTRPDLTRLGWTQLDPTRPCTIA